MIDFCQKHKKLLLVLFGYHLLFALLAYRYALHHPSDGTLYWFLRAGMPQESWGGYVNIGTDLMLFFNYPFAVGLKLPFWAGFLGYGIVGFLGIIQYMRLGYALVGDRLKVWKINLLPLFFFLPNLHYWTANLSKETWCFLWIGTILLKIQQKKYRSPSLWLSTMLLFILRPHVGLMLLFPISVMFLLCTRWKVRAKLIFAGIATLFLGLAFYGFLLLSKINDFNWQKIEYYNAYSILSFKHAGSYVPMLAYGYPMKLFSFYFRPFFLDAHQLYAWILSFENLLLLALHLLAVFLLFYCWKTIRFTLTEKIILLFYLVAGLLYVQRYAALGIFVRTKVMIQPFVVLVCLAILQRAQMGKVFFRKTELKNK